MQTGMSAAVNQFPIASNKSTNIAWSSESGLISTWKLLSTSTTTGRKRVSAPLSDSACSCVDASRRIGSFLIVLLPSVGREAGGAKRGAGADNEVGAGGERATGR